MAKRKRAVLTVCVLALIDGRLTLAAAASSQVQEVGLAIDVVAPEARAAAAAAAPDAQFHTASMELDEDGRPSVELAGRDSQGRDVEVDLYQVNEVWVVEEVERAITWRETPSAVRSALSALFLEGWRPDVIERSERPGGVILYELEGIDASRERIELEIDGAGGLRTINKGTAM